MELLGQRITFWDVAHISKQYSISIITNWSSGNEYHVLAIIEFTICEIVAFLVNIILSFIPVHSGERLK